jgi:hypothetical protein
LLHEVKAMKEGAEYKRLKRTFGSQEYHDSCRGECRISIKAILGICVAELTPEILARLDPRTGRQGVVVSWVDRLSPAMYSGLQCDDVIEAVNRRPVSSAAELERALIDYRDEPVLLRVCRGEEARLTVVGTRQAPGSYSEHRLSGRVAGRAVAKERRECEMDHSPGAGTEEDRP